MLGSVLGVMALVFVQLFFFDSIPGLNRFKLEAPSEQSTLPSLAIDSPAPVAAGLIQLGTEAVAESDPTTFRENSSGKPVA